MTNSSIWNEIDNSVPGTAFHRTLISLSKKFKPSSSAELNRAFVLAWKLFIKGYLLEAEKIVDFIGGIKFNGDYRLWVWIESSLLLYAWMLRDQGNGEKLLITIEKLKQPEFFEFNDELKTTVNRRARDRRLKGSLLSNHAEVAHQNNDHKRELHESELLFIQQLFIYFLADSETASLLDIEVKVFHTWHRINELVNRK